MRNADALLASELAMSTYRAVGHALKDDFRTRGLRVRCFVRLFSLNCCQAMVARAGSCHSVRSPVSEARCGCRMLPGRTGTSEQTWSKHGYAQV